ncbi:hypothetical protein K6Y31_20545 [Motilimonas cestriensis]|uniref:Uncharacterized protein n=1 Tax=Motilimonas cestriensis TaxID=2742685 RepID=A0ABS8WFP9_9GAMM|nr:hypothetical protein [Motilimonas cestriensis]MCE2597167.1 hypothetical protein [Motilimonas cestriensis]
MIIAIVGGLSPKVEDVAAELSKAFGSRAQTLNLTHHGAPERLRLIQMHLRRAAHFKTSCLDVVIGPQSEAEMEEIRVRGGHVLHVYQPALSRVYDEVKIKRGDLWVLPAALCATAPSYVLSSLHAQSECLLRQQKRAAKAA